MKTILSGMLLLFTLSCITPQHGITEVKTITPTEYKEQHAKDKKAVLVDVRTPAEFKAGHLGKAQNSDFLGGTFQNDIRDWDKDKTYYLYCASGNRSGKAAKLMQEAGFKKVYNIGGYQGLKQAGLPVKE
ncbi:rhodanese [Pontibacter sp. HJ8]